jgi:hydrogenase/urease accessory protein HupE
VKARVAAAAAFAAAAQGAAAHSTGGVVPAFFAPLMDAALVIALIAVALWAGQQDRARWVIGSFAAALALGLALNHWIAPSRTQDALLAATAATGLMVVIGRRWPAWLALIVGGAVGVQLGRGIELGASSGLARLNLAGAAWALACAGVVVCAWCVARLRWPWAKIGVRVAASWISASALLVLALAFAP